MIFYIQILSLTISIAAIFFCLKWYRIPFIQKKGLLLEDEREQRSFIRRQSVLRACIMLLSITLDVVVYYFLGYDGGLYLALMVAVAMVFVTPTKSQLESDYQFLYGKKD